VIHILKIFEIVEFRGMKEMSEKDNKMGKNSYGLYCLKNLVVKDFIKLK
jgi:hypothetical protein